MNSLGLWAEYHWWRAQGDRMLEFTAPSGTTYTLTLAFTFQGRLWSGKREGTRNGYLGQRPGGGGGITHGVYEDVGKTMAALQPWLEDEHPHPLEVELIAGELASLLASLETWDVEATLEGAYPGRDLALTHFRPAEAHLARFTEDLARYHADQKADAR